MLSAKLKKNLKRLIGWLRSRQTPADFWTRRAGDFEQDGNVAVQLDADPDDEGANVLIEKAAAAAVVEKTQTANEATLTRKLADFIKTTHNNLSTLFKVTDKVL